jgi:TPR repeat protein
MNADATSSVEPQTASRDPPASRKGEPMARAASVTLGDAPTSPAPSFKPSDRRPTDDVGLGHDDVELLIQRGDRFLMARDVIAARSYYERAAASGSTSAAFALARTFDPKFLQEIGATGVRPDAARAAAWYRAARGAGGPEAHVQLPALYAGSRQ